MLAFLGVMAAIAMTFGATMFVMATYTTGDYRPIMIRAITLAFTSTSLLAVCFRRMNRVGKIISVVTGLVNLVVIADALPRLQIG